MPNRSPILNKHRRHDTTLVAVAAAVMYKPEVQVGASMVDTHFADDVNTYPALLQARQALASELLHVTQFASVPITGENSLRGILSFNPGIHTSIPRKLANIKHSKGQR